jgi:hypothetical protein
MNKKLNADDMERLKVFGCQAWAKKLDRGKLDSKAEECVMVGYEENTKYGYRLWSIERRCIIIRRDVVFEDFNFPFKKENRKELAMVQVNPVTEIELDFLTEEEDDNEVVDMENLLEVVLPVAEQVPDEEVEDKLVSVDD